MRTPCGFLKAPSAFFISPHISALSFPFSNILYLKYPRILAIGAGAGPATFTALASTFIASVRAAAVFEAISSFLALHKIYEGGE